MKNKQTEVYFTEKRRKDNGLYKKSKDYVL